MTDLKTPLALAAKAFAGVCEYTDNAAVIDDRIKQLFADTHEELSYRVNKRIMFHRELELRKETTEALIELYKDQLKHLEQVHEKAKEVIKAEVESQPSIEFRGTLGKIWVQDNTPGVDYTFGENRGLKKETLDFLGVPNDLVKVESYRVDGTKVMALIDSGTKFTWAKKKQGRGVRFTALRIPKSERIEE